MELTPHVRFALAGMTQTTFRRSLVKARQTTARLLALPAPTEALSTKIVSIILSELNYGDPSYVVLQSCTKRWPLGCVNSPPRPEASRRPRAHILFHLCTSPREMMIMSEAAFWSEYLYCHSFPRQVRDVVHD